MTTARTTATPTTATLRSTWRTVNISPAERAGRILAGLVGIVGGLALLSGAASAVSVVLESLLVAAGLDMLVTGAIGHCPLYQKLGHVPTSLRAGAR